MKRRYMTSFALILLLISLLAACNTAQNDPDAQGDQPVTEQVVTVVVTSETDQTETKTVTQIVEVTATLPPEEVDAMNMVTMEINHGAEPPSLDPSIATDATSVNVITNIFVGLTRFDAQADVEPWAATDWTLSEDGRTYTFKLRDDLSWVYRNPSTGEIEEVRPLTAADFEYGIKRTLNPETASDYAYVLYAIEGAEAYNTADPEAEDFADVEAAVGVTAVDDTTLDVTFA
ncbi:MAG: hypothetical protein H6637_04605, partial [Ardenticatenales bacterium]|nr:hypothetical protein [Ardenticatenales bacterium]